MFNVKKPSASCYSSKFFGILLIALQTIPGFSEAAQTCNTSNIESSTINSDGSQRFVNNGDGTVFDKSTGLTWQRCVQGRSGENCDSGIAIAYTWSGAFEQAQKANKQTQYGKTCWRVPNINEFETIIEHQCAYPAINLSIFPNAANNSYWTSTPSPTAGVKAFQAYLIDGRIIINDKFSNASVILVCGQQ